MAGATPAMEIRLTSGMAWKIPRDKMRGGSFRQRYQAVEAACLS
jgi:hypothetical protein